MRPTVTCGVKRVTILGAFTPVHRCRLRPSIPCAVFRQDIHIPIAPDDRRYAGMPIRYVCVQRRGFVMRIWFGHRLCVIQHFLQEDHAYWFRDFSPQARQAKSTLLLIIHGISPYDPNLDVYRPSAIHGYTSGGSGPHHSSRTSAYRHPLGRLLYFPQRRSPLCAEHHRVYHTLVCITRHILDCLPLQTSGRNMYCASLVQSTSPPYSGRRYCTYILGALDVQQCQRRHRTR